MINADTNYSRSTGITEDLDPTGEIDITKFPSLYTPPSVARATKTAVGASVFVRFFSATFCSCWSLLHKAFVHNRKTSYTSVHHTTLTILYLDIVNTKRLLIFDKF